MADQLYSRFADHQALEAERDFILNEIFGKIKQGVLDLSKLGFKFESADTLKQLNAALAEITAKEKELAAVNQQLADSEKKLAAAQAQAAAAAAQAAGGYNSQAQGAKTLSSELSVNIQKQIDLKNRLKEIGSSLKQLNEFKAAAGSTKDFNDEVVRLTTEQAQLKQELSDTTKFIKNQIREFQAAEGSLDEMRAKLNQLNQAYDSLSDTDRESEFGKALLKQIKDFDAELKRLEGNTGRFQRNVGNYAGSAKIIVDAFERSRVKLTQIEQQFGKASPEAANFRKEFDALDRITKNPQFLNIAAKVGDATAEVRFFTKALIDLEQQGLKDSQVYRDTQAQLAKLTDQISDTRQEIKALSSDTRSFDLFSGAVSAATSVFQTAAGAAALFGKNTEEVQKSIQQLVAIENIANGVRAIANELTTRGTFLNKGYALVQNLVATAFDRSAAAAARFNAALGLIGIAATIIGAIAVAFAAFQKSVDDTVEKVDNLTSVMGDASAEYVKASTEVNTLKQNIEAAKQGFISKEDVVKQYNDTIGKTTGEVKSLDQAEKELAKNADAYIKFTLLKAAANIALQKAAEEAFKAEELALVGQRLQIGPKVEPGTGKTVESFGGQLIDFLSKGLQEKAKIQEQQFNDIAKNLIKQAQQLAKDFNFNFFGDGEEDDKAVDRARKNAETEFEIFKLRQQRKIKAREEETENEKNSYDQRLLALTFFTEESKKLIDAEAAFELTREKLTAKEIELINERRYDKIVALQEAAFERLNKIRKDQEKKEKEDEKKIAERRSPDTSPALKDIKEAYDFEIRLIEQRKEAYRALYAEVANTINALIGGVFDAEKNRLQEQIDKIEELKAAEISRISASTDGEEKKAARIKIIEAKAQAEKEALERKQRQADRQKAIFERVFKAFQISTSGIETVAKIKLAIAELTAKAAANPFLLPLIPLASSQLPIALGITAAQLVGLLATPLPKFWTGTESSPEGFAEVAEKGPELAVDPKGNTRLYEKHSLTYLMKGTKVYSADATRDIMRASQQEQTELLQAYSNNVHISIQDNRDLLERTVNELSELNKKPFKFIIHNEPGIESSAWYKHHFKW